MRIISKGVGSPFSNHPPSVRFPPPLIYLIWYSHKKEKTILNTTLLAFTFILIGYSSYSLVLIRANDNPPIDENNPENIKPLYGRQTYRGSNQWNYFTSLDSHLATKIPIYSGDKDCTEERGCQEINKNDMLNIGDPGKQYKANIYQTQAPRYIPYV